MSYSCYHYPKKRENGTKDVGQKLTDKPGIIQFLFSNQCNSWKLQL